MQTLLFETSVQNLSQHLQQHSIIFTTLHVMQTRYCDENSVCPSVCLSVCHTRVL